MGELTPANAQNSVILGTFNSAGVWPVLWLSSSFPWPEELHYVPSSAQSLDWVIFWGILSRQVGGQSFSRAWHNLPGHSILWQSLCREVVIHCPDSWCMISLILLLHIHFAWWNLNHHSVVDHPQLWQKCNLREIFFLHKPWFYLQTLLIMAQGLM